MTTFERWYAPAGGAISVDAGATVVQGSAHCTFTNQVVAGDALLIRSGPNAGLLLQVAETPSTDLQLVIDKPWPGVTQAGVAFAVLPISVKRSMAADIHARVSALYASLLHPFKVTGQPSDELGADGSIAIDPAARQFWIKSAGAWGTAIDMEGTDGEVTPAAMTAAIAAAVAALKGGAAVEHDTLDKLGDLIVAMNGGASAGYSSLKQIEDKLGPILAGANASYDTFAELFAYIQSDQSAAGAVTAALAARLRVDAPQGLSAPQQAQGVDNLGIAAKLVPSGGAAGQVLKKISAADHAVAWQDDLAGGGGGSAGTAPNLLINPAFQINQRAFAGGALAAAAYGHDRWKAATGGANYSVAGYVVSLVSGAIEQVLETEFIAGLASLASVPLVASFEVFAGSTGSVTLTAGTTSSAAIDTSVAGRLSVALVPGAGDAGNLPFRIAVTSGAPKIGRVKLEIGAAATAWQPRDAARELQLCQRYCPAYRNVSGALEGLPGVLFFNTTTTGITWMAPFPVPPRIPPTGIVTSAASKFRFSDVSGAVFGVSVSFTTGSPYVSQVNCVTDSGATNTLRTCSTLGLLAGGYIYWTGCEL